MNNPEYRCAEPITSFLRILGVWPRLNQIHKYSEKIYLCYTGFVFLSMVVYMAILTYGLSLEKDWSITRLPIEEVIVYSTGAIVLIKMVMLLVNQESLQGIIDYLNKNLNKKQILSEDDRREILSCRKHELFLIKLYAGSAGLMVVFFNGSSLIKMMRESWDGSYDTKLPLKYPFSITDRNIFILTYVHQFIIMILNGEVGTLADSIFSCLVFYLCGHLRIVRNRILSRNKMVEKSCVDYHNEIIMLIQRVEYIFQNFMFFMFASNSVLICLGLLQITQTDNPRRLSFEKSVLYLTIKVSQLFLYCWYGEEVKQRSSEISFACYSTNWYDELGRNSFQNFQFVLQRSQSPIQMRARSFFFISIATLKSVVNTSYSFFTMVNSLQK